MESQQTTAADGITDFSFVQKLFSQGQRPIPNRILVTYFKVDTTKNPDDRYTTIEARKFSSEVTGLIYQVNCAAGGICESTHMTLFRTDGLMTDHLKIGHHFGDGGFDRSLEYKFNGSFVTLISNEADQKENHEDSVLYSIDPLQGQVFQVEQSLGEQDGACVGSFKEFGTRRVGGTYHIYKSGRRVNLMNGECTFIFGEGVHNNNPEIDGVDTVKTHLIDVENFVIPTNSTEYGNEELKAKVICVSVNIRNRIKILVDPFGYGIYKAPKGWGSGEE